MCGWVCVDVGVCGWVGGLSVCSVCLCLSKMFLSVICQERVADYL